MIRSTRLDNGILVLSENMPGVRSVSLGYWFRSGSRHEPPELNGITHFIEHMLFRGTSSRSAHAIAREMDAVGGFLNAFTSREFCCLYAKVQGDKLPLAMDLLSDILLNSRFDAREIDKERRVVLQELHMVEETPEDCIHDLYSQLFWQGHPLGMPTSGSAGNVGSFDREQIVGYFGGHFTADKLMVCAAGDVQHEELVAAVEELLAEMPVGEIDLVDPPPAPSPKIAVEKRPIEQVHFCLGTSAVSQAHPDRFACFLLNAILGGGMSSRLFQSIREEHGLAYSIYSYLSTHIDTGSLVVYTATAPDDFERTIELVLQELRNLKAQPVDRGLLDDTRERLKGNLVLSLESTDNRMTRLAKNQLYLGQQPDIDQVLAAFDRVGAEDVLELAGRILEDASLNLQVLGQVDAERLSLSDFSLTI
ncbi:putative Zn-dependent peptidase [Geothermobacter ehrlichii]|uniref:Putative Zn-dependent peptidase n=1 Tax=Geothermobacter ehrlichii TaxID=213224 RepID=A0A5D3WLW8_9BACT|nr:pitrilysin family protein [Geothermobacter ehrlichii]TYO99722.1 putative Zn-dependent peptidase [Geothermobacter ehrlichii]